MTRDNRNFKIHFGTYCISRFIIPYTQSIQYTIHHCVNYPVLFDVHSLIYDLVAGYGHHIIKNYTIMCQGWDNYSPTDSDI